MPIPVTEPTYLELTGKGYNVMLQQPDQFGNFKVDLVLEGPELDKALEYQDEYGLKVKDTLKYPQDGGLKEESKKHVTVRATFEDNERITRKFIPTKDDQGEIIRDLISHGADLTVRFKVYPYKSGQTASGHTYKAGNGFQLAGVRVHSYEPFGKVANG